MLNTLLYYAVLLNQPPEVISDLSSLTRTQVETLKLHHAVLKGEINMDVALRRRGNLAISRGTHYRILGQAKISIAGRATQFCTTNRNTLAGQRCAHRAYG